MSLSTFFVDLTAHDFDSLIACNFVGDRATFIEHAVAVSSSERRLANGFTAYHDYFSSQQQIYLKILVFL